MNQVRKIKHQGLRVSYSDIVTEEQVRRIDELVREEFQSGEWVPVEKEV
jgi:hypothetical protein